MDITHDNVCSSMLSCFYSHLLSTGRPISSLTHKSYRMADNKSKTSLIRHIQKNISFIKINNIILVLHTCINIVIFVRDIFFLCVCHSGSFPL